MRKNFKAGEKHGRLLLIEPYVKRVGYKYFGRYLCDCGTEAILPQPDVRSGNTSSCGCLKRELATEMMTTHGLSHKGEAYRKWSSMLRRCYNPNHDAYPYYGGRGVIVRDRWRHDFSAFYSDMGDPPDGFTLDRIDPTGNYEPSNCRWATWEVQYKNKRKHKGLDRRTKLRYSDEEMED